MRIWNAPAPAAQQAPAQAIPGMEPAQAPPAVGAIEQAIDGDGGGETKEEIAPENVPLPVPESHVSLYLNEPVYQDVSAMTLQATDTNDDNVEDPWKDTETEPEPSSYLPTDNNLNPVAEEKEEAEIDEGPSVEEIDPVDLVNKEPELVMPEPDEYLEEEEVLEEEVLVDEYEEEEMEEEEEEVVETPPTTEPLKDDPPSADDPIQQVEVQEEEEEEYELPQEAQFRPVQSPSLSSGETGLSPNHSKGDAEKIAHQDPNSTQQYQNSGMPESYSNQSVISQVTYDQTLKSLDLPMEPVPEGSSEKSETGTGSKACPSDETDSSEDEESELMARPGTYWQITGEGTYSGYPDPNAKFQNHMYADEESAYLKEEDIKEKISFEENLVWLCTFFLFCMFITAVAFLIPLFTGTLNFDGGENGGTTASPVPTKPPGPSSALILQPTTPMDPYIPETCEFQGMVQPHVVLQCSCRGSVVFLQDDIRRKYEALRLQFAPTLYPTWNYAANSCDPVNMALIWVSSGYMGSVSQPGFPIGDPEMELLQRFALAVLFFETNGPRWQINDNWLEQPDICVWFGVSCENRFVSSLSLGGNNLVGELPAELGLLEGVKEISLDRNLLKGTLPPEVFYPIDIRVISLSFNELVGSIPFGVTHAEHLQILRLNHNGLEGTVPLELSSTRLIELNLAFNNLRGALPKELGRLTNLASLSVDSNPSIDGTIPPEMSFLTGLQFLSLSNTTIHPSIPNEFGSLTKLTDLRIADTKRGDGSSGASVYDYRIPTVLGNLRDLRVLLLNTNGMTGTIPSELGYLTKLEALMLHGNDLSGVVPSELGQLSKLGVLSLDGNDLTARIPDDVCNLRTSGLSTFTTDCPSQDGSGIVCPIPSCCTSCAPV